MKKTLIENVRLVVPGESVRAGGVLVDAGKIASLNPEGAVPPAGLDRIDGGGRLLTPGLIDMHTHGIRTHQYELGPDHLRAASETLPAYGTTAVCPTIVPMPGAAMLRRLEAIADAIPGLPGAVVPGFHLEGPFMAITGAACPTVPGDVGLLNELVGACRGRVAIMSVSPETPGIIPVVERLRELGIAVFMTHTRATVEQTQAAVDAGARHATHFYDVFPVPPEREPGVRPVGAVEVILADRRVTVDFICDGCHVPAVVVRMGLAAKGCEGVALISDSNIGAGLPPGEYDTPWGYRVRVRPGDGARHAEKGFLAGSALTMNEGVANLRRWLDLPDEQVWAMGTSTPARVLGLRDKGVLRPGADADLVLWADDLRPARTWVGGRVVYDAQHAAS